jgi:hypothetical protein
MITQTSDHQVIWLREKGGKRSFPILIGIFEALAIHRKIKEEDTIRPMTHDLLANVIAALHFRLSRVIVTSLRENTFFAKLVLGSNGTEVEIDSRPSDAIALAVRLEAPIFVAEEVLQEVAKDESA